MVFFIKCGHFGETKSGYPARDYCVLVLKTKHFSARSRNLRCKMAQHEINFT